MKHTLPPLDSLKAFEAAARHLNFSLAAQELCISKGAISYQIQKLEEAIKCKLFRRSVRQVYLTEAGQTLFQTTKQIFNSLDQSLIKLQESKQQTSVTIAATTYVSARWLSSRISRFNEMHPSINIQFQHSVNSAEFKLDEVDLAVRWEQKQNKLDQKRFAEITMSLFPSISPRFLQNHGIDPTKQITIESLLEAPFNTIPLLCEDRSLDLWQEWFEKNKPQGCKKTLANPRRIISDANVRVQAAVDNQGLILSDELMSYELNNGLLVAPFKEKLDGYCYALLSSPAHIYSENALLLKQWITDNH